MTTYVWLTFFHNLSRSSRILQGMGRVALWSIIVAFFILTHSFFVVIAPFKFDNDQAEKEKTAQFLLNLFIICQQF